MEKRKATSAYGCKCLRIKLAQEHIADGAYGTLELEVGFLLKLVFDRDHG